MKNFDYQKAYQFLEAKEINRKVIAPVSTGVSGF
jgi:hypothetical protein